jgi:hypothetical protein
LRGGLRCQPIGAKDPLLEEVEARAGLSAEASHLAVASGDELRSPLGDRWCVDQLGTPRVRCDEHNGKFSLSYETKV